ncbi:carbon-nitrogen family hydrolase [Anaerobacillus sp. CMMVII]|uniref:carbon-nitrogen family hydrolase n=1 Tax=Anaerobacillus sp. CMMVII TaxID=2755588 RepID=UPI0021B7DCD0|nr:carbon-nitrogen family hydrolase [Anaerobacillus sp. CMMVII]MCT8138386.1 carbon-nitrogen family hydrolase [Anaerobacillus sp. CMMVII]
MFVNVTCLQIDIDFGNPVKNQQRVKEEITKAISHSPDVIVLPELWSTGYDLPRLDEIADDNGTYTKHFLSQLAKTHHVNIVGGSVAKKSATGVTNTMYIFDRQGNCVGEYSKVHLFKLMDEHLYLQAGNKMGHFELEGVPSSGVVCYDIRFPEWIRAHTTKGAEIVFVVAEWPLARVEHWRTLLLSRAIENQCYVVACNRTGHDPNNEFAGNSMIIDPWGNVVAEAGKEPMQLTANLDLEKVTQVRSQIPIFADRRTDLY